MKKLFVLVCAFAATAPSIADAQSDTLRAVVATWAAQPTVGVDTALVYFNRGGQRQLGITYVETVAKTPAGYLVVQQNVRPTGQVVTLDSIEIAAGTLAPIWHADVTPRGRMRVEFAAGRMKGKATDLAGASSAVDSAVAAGAMDFSTAASFVRLLPLKAGYHAVLLTNDVHRGTVPVEIRVTGEESVDVAGRAVKAWVVENTTAGRTVRRWIEQASRREIKVLVDMGNGATMEMERPRAP
jgi:hypothetical protein